MIKPGIDAPGFTLPDQDGKEVSLADFAGRHLVLAFYPLDFSPTCTDQLSLYQEVLGELEAKDTALVGVSVDSSFSHRAFREHLNLTMPLLSDFHPKGEAARAYGVYSEKWGSADRSLFLLDPEGIVRWAHRARGGEVPGANLIFDALAA